jgi:hypothetical protein
MRANIWTILLIAVAGVLPAADTFTLRTDVLDAETGAHLACRVYIQSSNGSWHFAKSPGSVEYRKQKDWNPGSVEMHTTHAAGPITASLAPGKYTVLVERGKEYLPESREVNIENEDAHLKMRLRRWINMAESGWYSGDTHVHRPLSELPNLLLAEDLNVAFPLTSWVTDAFVSPTKGRTNADQHVRAELIKVDKTHVIYPRNTEYEIFRVGPKSHTLGAFFVLGHKSLFDTGVPPVRPVAEKAHREGALLELDKHNWEWSMMLVPIMGVDLYELSNNHIWRTEFGYRDYGVQAADYMQVERDAKGWTERGWIDYGFQNYYALLNCGFRLRPTAGTASGVHPVPLGFGRVYVHLKEGFSYDAWMRGLNEGRSFVTTGPMLFVDLKDARLTGAARSAVPLQSIEVIVNGEVARKLTPGNREIPGKGYESVIDTKLDIDGSSWIAVRCFEDRPDKRIRFAHTAPVYVEVPRKPLRPRRVEIDYLIKRIETELSRNADVLPAAALDEYREALRIYQDIARNAR